MSGVVVWFTGLPSSGKSAFAERVRARLSGPSCVLDGDRVRQLLHPNPSYTQTGRDDFYATLADFASELAQQGLTVLVAATAGHRAYRERARQHAPHFLEVWLESSLEECRKRDAKGLYKDFAEGAAHGVPGEDAPYEPPQSPDVRATGAQDDAALEQLLQRLAQGAFCSSS